MPANADAQSSNEQQNRRTTMESRGVTCQRPRGNADDNGGDQAGRGRRSYRERRDPDTKRCRVAAHERDERSPGFEEADRIDIAADPGEAYRERLDVPIMTEHAACR